MHPHLVLLASMSIGFCPLWSASLTYRGVKAKTRTVGTARPWAPDRIRRGASEGPAGPAAGHTRLQKEQHSPYGEASASMQTC